LSPFLVNSVATFLVEKPGNTVCFDSEVDMHSLSLGNLAFSSNPSGEGSRNLGWNKTELVTSYYAHLFVGEKRVPAPGGLT